MDLEMLKSKVIEAGQGHLVRFWENLTDVEKQALTKDLENIHFEEVNGFFRDAEETLKTVAEKIDDQMEPLPAGVYGSVTRSDPDSLKEYEKLGLYGKLLS